jgi:hypothetical protein
MQIRQMETADAPRVRITAETLAAAMYPELIPDIAKTHGLLEECYRNHMKHYARVVGPKGEPKAVLIAMVRDNMWATKRHATVVCWWSDIPGAGVLLLRDFKKWVQEQNGIVLAGFNDDCDLPLVARMVAMRTGFERRGGGYMYFPKGSKRK